jgi:predicted PurR-regulated permease PerM
VISNAVSQINASSIETVARSAGVELVRGVSDALINIVLTLVISIYLVADAKRLIQFIHRVTPVNHKEKVRFLEDNLHHVVGGYVRGQLTMGLIIASTTGLGLTIFGVRFAPLVAVAAFFLALVPILGTLLTGVLAALAASLNGLYTVIAVVLFYTVLHLLESNVLSPRITGQAVGVPPPLAILVLIAGGKLFGVWGAALAVPATGLIMSIVAALYHHSVRSTEA